MNGYKFTTEQEAINAKLSCDTYYGYPKVGCETLGWVMYEYSEIDDIYYIQYHESLEPILGTPIEFTITLPELSL